MSAEGGGERHVGPPRTLEIQKFAAARSAEVQALYNAVKDQVESSGGDPSSLTIARHLRRRTTSHNRRVPYWILNERKKNRDGRAPQKRKETKKNETPSAPGASEKRKAERPPPCRRVRRRIEFQRVRQGEDIVQRDGTRRLATHIWHAKRFPMTKCWGYSLPEGRPGRGRGSRAVLKWVKEAAVLHDASYYGLIELQGTSEAIAQSLQHTVEPAVWFSSSGSLLKKAEAHGLLSGNAVLYQFEKAPYEAIAPITFLWRPPTSCSKLGATGPEQAPAKATPEERQLWIWVHPGAYESSFQCLSTACERQEKDDETNLVKCRSRRSEFARLEILGSKAMEVIRKVIHPTSRKFGTPRSKAPGQPSVRDSNALNPGYPKGGDFQQPSNLAFFSKAEFLPSSAALALDVLDPRCTSGYCPSFFKAGGDVGDHCTHKERHEDIHSASETMGDDGEGRTEDGASDGDECLLDDEDHITYCARWLNMGEEGLSREVSDSEYLWNPESGANGTRLAPMSEKKLCKKRHEKRKKFLLSVDQQITTNGAESNSKDQLDTSRICPVLLLKSSKSMSPACGWTIILPIKWVHAFWVPLVFAGGRVIGLREHHWLATNAGIPHFPHDFPDCSTYAQLLTVSIKASNEANRKRPPAKRGPCFVVSPLQVSILRVFEDSNRSNGDTGTDEPFSPFIRAESILSPSFESQSADQVPCIENTEKLVHNVEEPHDASFKGVEGELNEKRSDPEECQNDDQVVPCAVASVPMVIEHSSDSVILETRNGGEGLGTSQPGLETFQAGKMACTISVAEVNSGATVISKLLGTNRDTQLREAGLHTEGQAVANLYPQCAKPGDEVYRSTSGGAAVFTGGPQTGSLPLESAYQVDVVTGYGTDLAVTATGQSSIERNIQEGDLAMRAGEAVSSEAGSRVLQPDLSGAAVKTFTDDGDGSFDQNAPSEPSVKLEKNLPVEEVKAKLLSGLSARWGPDPEPSDFRGAAVETRPISSDAVTVGVEDLNATKKLDTEPAIRDCKEVAREVNLKSDESMDWVGQEDKDIGAECSGENAGKKSLPFFVARTQTVLLERFNQSGFQQSLFLYQGVTSRGTSRDALQRETVRWSARSEAASNGSKSTPVRALVNGEEKVCYMRVLVSVPRKGVMEEGAVIFSPSKEDCDLFLRSKEWQGPSVLQPRSAKRKKCKEKKVKSADADASYGTVEGSKDTYEIADAFCEVWTNSRKSIGLITSSVPRGSTGPCIGICDVGALMSLRAAQSGDQRCWDRSDIFVLAGNKYSSKLRPSLISLPLERAEHDIEWL